MESEERGVSSEWQSRLLTTPDWGMGGPLPLSPVSLLGPDEENVTRSRGGDRAHMGGGLGEGKKDRPLRLGKM